MSEENKNKSHRGFAMVMAVAIAIPLLYVLSIGPAAAICAKHPKYFPALFEFYSPLLWFVDKAGLAPQLRFYVSLWG